MATTTMNRKGYKRLKLDTLNFLSDDQVDKEKVEDVTPIQWVKEVFTGEKQVVIKKQ